MDQDLARAVEFVAYKLLCREYFDTVEMKTSRSYLERENTPEDAIRKAIQYGGGSSIDGCGQYWYAHWMQGPNINILKEDCEEIKIPAGKFMAVVRRIWDKEKNKQTQLF